MRNVVTALIATVVLMLSGCAATRCCCPNCSQCACATCNPQKGESLTKPADFDGERPLNQGAAKVYAVAPTQLVDSLDKALKDLGFTVVSREAGQLQTDWRDYEGEFHIARRWQERSRFRVSVIPDVEKPTAAARFEIAEETQRRSNSKANWEPASARPQRVQELAKQLDSRISAK